MRLRYFELPSQANGGDVRTPFLLVFDKVDGDDEVLAARDAGAIKDVVGAAGVLVVADGVTVDFE